MVDRDELTRRAIEAAKTALGREIVIPTDQDLTPPGKRTVRVVRHLLSGRRSDSMIRWYVGGKAYRTLPLTNSNVELSADWKKAAP